MINKFITERWDVAMIYSQAPWGVQSGLVVGLAGVGNDDYPLWFGDCEKPLLVSKISVRCTISYLQCAFIWIFWVLIWKLNGCVLIILSYFASQLFHGVHWAQEVMFYFDYPSQSKELVWGRKAVSLGLWSCDWGLEWGGCGSPCCWWPLPGERPLTEAAHSPREAMSSTLWTIVTSCLWSPVPSQSCNHIFSWPMVILTKTSMLHFKKKTECNGIGSRHMKPF